MHRYAGIHWEGYLNPSAATRPFQSVQKYRPYFCINDAAGGQREGRLRCVAQQVVLDVCIYRIDGLAERPVLYFIKLRSDRVVVRYADEQFAGKVSCLIPETSRRR